MWILIEDGRLVNLEMATDIVPDHRAKTAQVLCSGVHIAQGSILYQKIFVEKILDHKE